MLNPLIHTTPAEAVTDADRSRFRREAEKLLRSGVRVFGEMAALHIAPHALDQVPPDHPLFLLLVEIAAERNVPIDFHMEAVTQEMAVPKMYGPQHQGNVLRENISGLKRLLAHDARARIVWQHLGWDFIGRRTAELTRRLLQAHPNLYIAIRAHGDRVDMAGRPLANRIHDDAGNIRAGWLELFQEFPDRFVVGSDEFVGPEGVIQGKGSQVSFEKTWGLLKRLPPDLARRFGRENAARIYGW